MCNCCCGCGRHSNEKLPPPPKFHIGQVVRTMFVKNKVYRDGHLIEIDHCGVVEKVFPMDDLLNYKVPPNSHNGWGYLVRMCPSDKGAGVNDEGIRQGEESFFEAVQRCCCLCCHHCRCCRCCQ